MHVGTILDDNAVVATKLPEDNGVCKIVNVTTPTPFVKRAEGSSKGKGKEANVACCVEFQLPRFELGR